MSSNLSNLSFGFGSNIYKQTNFEKGEEEENIIIKKPMKITNVNKIIWANMYSTLGYCCTNNNNNDGDDDHDNNTLKIFGFDVLFNKEGEEKIITPTTLKNLNKPKRFFGNDLYGLIGYIDINGNLYKLDDHKKHFDVDDDGNNKYNINIIDIDQFWNGDEVIFVTGKLKKIIFGNLYKDLINYN